MRTRYPTLHLLSALWLLFSACASQSFGTTRVSSYSITSASNLRQIGQASLIYAQDHNEQLPSATDVWDYARLIAASGIVEDSRLWLSPVDPANKTAYSEQTPILAPAIAGQPRKLTPAFRQLKLTVAVPVDKRLNVRNPATTPIAWTRGLQPDGTWAAHSPYGSVGGHIIFLGGNLAFYKNLGTPTAGELVRFDGQGSTNNILEALPPGTRISEYIPTPAEQREWAHSNRINTSSGFVRGLIKAGIGLALLWIPVIAICVRKIDQGILGKLTLITVSFFISLFIISAMFPIV